MRLCELKGKTVINDTDCCILGFVVDIDFDPSSGCILALIVPGPARLCGLLGRDFEYVIPFKCIRTIGPDIILVHISVTEVFAAGSSAHDFPNAAVPVPGVGSGEGSPPSPPGVQFAGCQVMSPIVVLF